MTTASYEDEGVAERRAQKAPRRRSPALNGRATRLVTYGRGQLAEREAGRSLRPGELGPPSPTGARAARLLLS
jgi:hypothetical protein